MQIPDTPLFVKTHDFNVWLIRHTQRFPKSLRYTLTQRLENLALEFEECLWMANAVRGRARTEWLTVADGKLLSLRGVFRYTLDFELLGSNQVKFALESLDELGRLLGAWLKGTDRKAPALPA